MLQIVGRVNRTWKKAESAGPVEGLGGFPDTYRTSLHKFKPSNKQELRVAEDICLLRSLLISVRRYCFVMQNHMFNPWMDFVPGGRSSR